MAQTYKMVAGVYRYVMSYSLLRAVPFVVPYTLIYTLGKLSTKANRNFVKLSSCWLFLGWCLFASLPVPSAPCTLLYQAQKFPSPQLLGGSQPGYLLVSEGYLVQRGGECLHELIFSVNLFLIGFSASAQCCQNQWELQSICTFPLGSCY